jgi:ubiquinone/menaquinone biosynthesis C-methylase UbiE/uncharacterized protein YbaR (Trm112 family)
MEKDFFPLLYLNYGEENIQFQFKITYMKIDILELLRSPGSGEMLTLVKDIEDDRGIVSGKLVGEKSGDNFPIRNSIPRFVPVSNYADNFGMQWNLFSATQLDSHAGHPISSDRFWESTGWTADEIKGKWVLDVGCGSGRFAEVALQAGANVVALDYSSAVDACFANLKHYPNLHVVQGNIYELPFKDQVFDFIYSLGVLQHTPDVKSAFEALPPLLKFDGKLCVDYYAKSWKSVFEIRHWLRPVTKRISQKKLFSALRTLVPVLLPLSRAVSRVPVVGKYLKNLVPVVNFYDEFPYLTPIQHREWSLLDTFDWLSPRYDNPQTRSTAHKWMLNAGLKKVEVLKPGHLVARGQK